jgi:hypothetical protein
MMKNQLKVASCNFSSDHLKVRNNFFRILCNLVEGLDYEIKVSYSKKRT